MRYISTRNGKDDCDFATATIEGLAPDGGLFVPASIPRFEPSKLASSSYSELAKTIFKSFVGDALSEGEINSAVDKAYAVFDDPNVVSLKDYAGHPVLELFHGPTLAFKDIALQFLGQVFGILNEKHGEHINVLGATSGDTGGAAISGLEGVDGCQVFMLYPRNRVSLVQQAQITRSGASNVYPIELNGSFDDAQALVKNLFSDKDRRKQLKLTAVNSINWCRIMAQTVYYAYISSQYDTPVSFSVPTGNFGDVLAGYYAKRMGFPVDKLIIACNDNDLLARFAKTGLYQPQASKHTLSPAMDIQVASNFERVLFEIADRDASYINQKMSSLAEKGMYSVEPEVLQKFNDIFEVYTVSNEQTRQTIQHFCDKRVIVEPHTAVGLCAAEQARQSHSVESQIITLATAHPLKFKETIEDCCDTQLELTTHLQKLMSQPEKKYSIENLQSELLAFLENRIQK
ncbi:MAG: threonine synthase [Gammaproteobacteria bacterium]|nr:threonine synthase [Gammaproteobacteria bacterium]